VAMPLAWKLLPKPERSGRRRHDYDPVGVALLGAGIVVLLLPLVNEQQWQGHGKWLLVPVAVLLLAAFVAWEFRYTRRDKESLVAVQEFPQNGTGWATVVPLLIGGLGAGLVIAPNQTLTLSQVPVQRAGTAGGLLQVGQRIGAAIGIAAVGSVFFARVASSRGDFASAFQHGILVASAFIVAALILAIVDVVVDRRIHRAGG